MSLSAFIVLCLPLLCSVPTCIFWMHSYVIVLVVVLKTIKTVLHHAVRITLLCAEVLNTATANPCGTLLCAACLLLWLINPTLVTILLYEAMLPNLNSLP